MSDLFLLGVAQVRRIEPYFPLSRGIEPVTMSVVLFRFDVDREDA